MQGRCPHMDFGLMKWQTKPVRGENERRRKSYRLFRLIPDKGDTLVFSPWLFAQYIVAWFIAIAG
jgi:hypothetical protein